MRIGIISMQRIVNTGSFLQAYGLYNMIKYLIKEKDDTIEFIDYENEMVLNDAKRKNRKYNTLRKVKHYLFPKYWRYEKIIYCTQKTKSKFGNAARRKFNVTGMVGEKNYPFEKKYDLVIIGSDEVFNIRQFLDDNTSFPWVLFGEGIQTNRLISYAAACGQTSFHFIEMVEEREHLCDLLRHFNEVSVRDKNSLNVVTHLGVRNAQIHIDPVLANVNFPEEENFKPLHFRYMIVYAYSWRINDKNEIAAIREYARIYKLKIVCINVFQEWADVFISASPFAVLQYFEHAECIVTDTFHGTVFSIRARIPFAVFVRESNGNKIRFLLEQFDMCDREVLDPNELPSVINKPIDKINVEQKLEVERIRTMDYLSRNIRMEDS